MKWEVFVKVISYYLLQSTDPAFSFEKVLEGHTKSPAIRLKTGDTANLLMRPGGSVCSCLVEGVRRNLRCFGNTFRNLT